MAGPQSLRRCALCLCTTEKVFCCAACKRRVYCSKECQKADWKKMGPGQGHKVWCGLEYGEEDIDWEIREISADKGLGVVALKTIPAGFRIMVEKGLTMADVMKGQPPAAVHDLCPKGGSLKETLELNSMSCRDHGSVLCVRGSRFNHACDPNACHCFESGSGVKVFIAEREIKVGEEIVFSYFSIDDIGETHPPFWDPAFRSSMLKIKWGITCPPDCICNDKKRRKLVQEARELDGLILKRASVADGKGALGAARQLIKLEETLKLSIITRCRTYYDAFQAAIMRRESIPEAMKYIKLCHELNVQIGGPESVDARQAAEYMANPSRHPAYLV